MSDPMDEMFAVMMTGRDSSGEWDIPKLREGFNFKIHGVDAQGRWDIEFPTMFEAIEWFRMWRSDIAEFATTDTVTSLDDAVIIVMTPKHKL